MKPISVVIPLVEAHDTFVDGLLSDLANESYLVEEVILARSGLSASKAPAFHRRTSAIGDTLPFTVRIDACRKHRTAGENRNRVMAQVATSFVAFMDADDLYARGRLSLLLNVAESRNSNLVIHDFGVSHDALHTPEDISEACLDIISTDELREATFPRGRRRALEGSSPGDTNIVLPDAVSNSHGVHHGHTLVRTSVFEHCQFSRRYPGEDGQFCRDVLWELGHVEYVPVRLSAYRSSLSAGKSTSLRGKVKRRLRKMRAFG